jgi:hypothetical protein
VYPRTTIEKNKEVINLFVYDFETKSNEKLGARDFNRINSTGVARGRRRDCHLGERNRFCAASVVGPSIIRPAPLRG